MANSEYLRMVEAARLVVDEITPWLKNVELPKEVEEQMRTSSTSVTFNLAEGMGRSPGGDRRRFMFYARGSAEELNENLRTCHAAEWMEEKMYWRLHNRLVTVVRMINSYVEKMNRTTRT